VVLRIKGLSFARLRSKFRKPAAEVAVSAYPVIIEGFMGKARAREGAPGPEKSIGNRRGFCYYRTIEQAK
jgi:hypothetical protein